MSEYEDWLHRPSTVAQAPEAKAGPPHIVIILINQSISQSINQSIQELSKTWEASSGSRSYFCIPLNILDVYPAQSAAEIRAEKIPPGNQNGNGGSSRIGRGGEVEDGGVGWVMLSVVIV